MKRNPLTFILLFINFLAVPATSLAQSNDSSMVDAIYREALTSKVAYDNLHYLCTNIGGRLCGSLQAADAVTWTRNLLANTGADTVYLQPVSVPHWVRGERETARIISADAGEFNVHVCALGGSLGTGPDGLSAGVIEVRDFDSLLAMGKEVRGKIVFFNRPADQSFVNTFRSYSSAVDQRVSGPSIAAGLGAVGVVVRSVTTALDTVPHTGITRYDNDSINIPAIAISTLDADLLSKLLIEDSELTFYFRTTSSWMPDEPSHNVIGEIRGREFPDEYITVGGHLDSWDLGEGAHDDGAGCIQAIEVLRLFKSLNILPRRTVRFVMFMDEEIDQRGSKEYARQAAEKNEKHFLALEADRGGFTPSGFSIDVPDTLFPNISKYSVFFNPYGADRFIRGGSGPDIWRLKEFGAITAGLVVDSQRYFDYHHSAKDTYDKINRRELQLGSAAMASLIYILDRDSTLK